MTRRPVAFELRSYGYDPTLPPYANANNPNTWSERTPAVLEQVSPTPKTYAPGLSADVATMTWSHTGDVTGQVIPVKRITIPPAGTADGNRSGCAISDFPPEVQGNIALIQRGQCTFLEKVVKRARRGREGRADLQRGPDRPHRPGLVGHGALRLADLPGDHGRGAELRRRQGPL